MKTAYSFAMTVLAAALIAAYGCSKKEEAPAPKVEAPAAPQEVVVRIGLAAPLTGSQAHLGKDEENGAQLAIADANAKGAMIDGKKIKFELVSQDDQADPKLGTLVAQKLIDAKVAGVVGHLNSGTTIPASKLYSDAGIPQISPSATNPKYTQQGFKTAFRVMANDVQQGTALGQFAVKDLKAKKIAVIDDATAYGQGLADETEKTAKADGAAVVAREHTSDKETDFKAVLTRIKSKKPDVIMFGGMDAQGGPMVKQMKELGIKAKFIAGDGVCSTDWAKNPAAADQYCSQAGLPTEKMPAAADFVKRFTAKYGPIQIYAPYAYDATTALIEAMKKANSTDPAKYLPELAKSNYDGVTAKIAFDDKGDTKYGFITMYEVKDGKLNPLSTIGGGEAAAPAADAKPADKPAEPKKDEPAKK
jgi:branched-chain amino acid transport system substrate-binding protein